nr:hypothetical protein [uncultured Pseudodesulfovibrio sp.]
MKIKYITATDSGFFHSGSFLGTSLDVRITLAGTRLLKWEIGNHIPKSKPYSDEAPIDPGWVLAYDLNLDMNHSIYCLTITGEVIKKALNPYGASLKEQKKKISQVLTRISVAPGVNGRALFKFEEVL